MLNPSISSQLFHFTGFDKASGSFKPDLEAFNILQQIIQSHQLRLSPNKVHLALPKGVDVLSGIDVDVYMACLTETPLEFIVNHIAKYGKFGLGFKVEWALKNNGQNVIYCDQSAPNSYAHTIAEIGGYFIRNGAGTDFQKARWIADLAATTESFETRDEREWRFLRGSLVDNKFRAIEFSSDDLQTIVCPKQYISDIRTTLRKQGFDPKIVATEDYWPG